MKYRILTDRAVLRRPTNVLLSPVDGSTTATITLDRAMPEPAYLLFDADGQGTGFVTGLAAGATVTEMVSITAEGLGQTENEFSSVAGMTFTNLTGNVSVRAVDRSGQPRIFYEDICEFVPCKVFDRQVTLTPSARGETEQEGFRVYVGYDPAFRVCARDVIYVYDPASPSIPGMTYRLEGVMTHRSNRGRPLFYTARGVQL